MVLDPSKLTKTEKNKLLNVFADLKGRELPSLLEQLTTHNPIRKKIDNGILEVLGFTKKEANELLQFLYPALAKEIQNLKSLMEG